MNTVTGDKPERLHVAAGIVLELLPRILMPFAVGVSAPCFPLWMTTAVLTVTATGVYVSRRAAPASGSLLFRGAIYVCASVASVLMALQTSDALPRRADEAIIIVVAVLLIAMSSCRPWCSS